MVDMPTCKICGFAPATQHPAEIMEHLLTHPEARAEFEPLRKRLEQWKSQNPDWSNQALDWYLDKTGFEKGKLREDDGRHRTPNPNIDG